MSYDEIDVDGYYDAVEAERRRGIAEAYGFAKFFDFALVSDSGEMRAAVDDLIPILRTTVAARGGHRSPLEAAVQSVLANLCRNHGLDPDLYTAYPRCHEGYPDRRYNPLNVKLLNARRAIDGFAELGLVTNHIGFFRREFDYRRRSRMRAEPALIDLLRDRYGLTHEHIQRYGAEETIILRGADKRQIAYADTAATIAMRRQLETYNRALEGAVISVDLTPAQIAEISPEPIDFSAKRYWRVFARGSFELGGRFYGPCWVNTKKGIRPHILIDGEPTIECDYSGAHIHILYSLLGINYHQLDPDGDPYALEGAPNIGRDFVKSLSLTAINVRSRRSALASLRKRVEACPGLEDMNVNEVLLRFEEKHHPIQGYFYADAGVMLQYHDSQICEYIIGEMLQRGIVCLSIHDSFIVQRRYEELLKCIMRQAFEKKEFCSIPPIKNSL